MHLAVIPCYKVKNHILAVIHNTLKFVDHIVIVDDCCPESTGDFVSNQNITNVTVIYNKTNLGVGGATKAGFIKANQMGASIIIKVDGDGQMDSSLIPTFIKPLHDGACDYAKGNRFYKVNFLKGMPILRIIGNAGMSFFSKMASGHWRVMDPTNGFFAIKSSVAAEIDLQSINNRYFFESDLLYHLGLIGAKVNDIPMPCHYEDEVSNLSVSKCLFSFPGKFFVRILTRLLYNYFLRDFNIGSIAIILSSIFFPFGVIFGLFHWYQSIINHVPATSGTVMVAALSIIIGIQSLVLFFQYDIEAAPKESRFP